ncbi:MAG: ABC transporter permease [Candidatus Gracilibacteria bacterium]|jgi:putative ABC transport system permease protein|nr:ABC transporter permease [Candidatus Gracilibacteria bacterium]
MLILSIKNIRQRKFRTFLITLAVTIGTMSMLIFMGLSEGIKKATFEEMEKNKSLNEITVRPKVENSKTLAIFKAITEKRITKTDLEKISNIEGIDASYPETQFNSITSLEADIMGFSLITDAMLFGLDEGYLINDIKIKDAWKTTSEPYPAIISGKLLDIYNLTIAVPQGLPTVSESSLVGKEITMYPGYSTFFPGLQKKKDQIKFKVVGFSDKVNLIGATIPPQILHDLNQKYSSDKEDKFLQVHLMANSPEDTPKIAEKVQELNFFAKYLLEDMKTVSAKFDYLTYALSAISLIILLTSSLAIIATFLAQIAERIKELGLYRALGARKKHIRHLILIEAGLIGFVGSVFGTILGSLISTLTNTYISNTFTNLDIIPDTFIVLNLKTFTTVILFGTIIALLSAYYPALKAGKISPIKAISK